jgi:hypothetical protein
MQASPATEGPTKRRSDLFAIWFGIALTAAAYGWTLFAVNINFVARDPLDHYAYLTDALLSGQLHLKLQPDPQLANLENPYAGSQGVPRLHDATYFNGVYYLYFGPTPVVLLLGPWHLLTRTYLLEGVATVAFAFAGFLISALLWVHWKRRFLPGLPNFWLGFAIVMLGLGNYVFFLIQTPMVYEVPISCGYACLMASLGFVIAALDSETPIRQSHRLGLASLVLGLAVGARPDYVFTLPALGLPLAVLWRRARQRDGPGAPSCRRLVYWTVAPAAIVGGLLAAYNWARFGDIMEFGLKYQLASTDLRNVKVTDLANLPGGLHDYLFPAPHYFAHFPFLSASAETFGVLPWAPFALFALAFPLTWFGAVRRDRSWVFAGGFLLVGCLLSFGAVCMVTFRNDRYAVDFLPAATWLALFVMATALAAVRRLWRMVGSVLALVAVFTLGHSILLGLSGRPLPALARVFDYPVAVIERLSGVRYGPLILDVRFPAKPVAGQSEPLLAMAAGADVLYETQPDEDHVQFRFFHRGVGGPSSDAIPIDVNRTHLVELDLGALYPQPDHPLFAGWPENLIDALRRRLRVRLDGRMVLDRAAVFYPNDFFHTTIGSNPGGANGEKSFAGAILGVRRGQIPSPSQVAAVKASGPVRLTLRFPEFTAIYGEPLISTGRSSVGDLFYVTYLGPGLVRFGHDCWNYGPAETPPISYDPSKDQVVEVEMGSLIPGQTNLLEGKTRFQLRFNGKLVASAYRPFHPSDPVDIVFGFNAIHASTAAASFTGAKLQVDPIPAFPPPAPVVAGGGTIHLSVKFPANKPGGREPLLVTGRTGAGDSIYVVYADDSHIRFGYDHWGTPGAMSPPVAIDYGVTHDLTISMSSLDPPGSRTRDAVGVTCDGDVALNAPGRAYPARPDEIAIGTNSIGGSACDPQFNGGIYLTEQSSSF